MLVQVVHLFLTGELLVTGQCDDLHTGSHHEEGHIETDLVVTGTCGAMGDGIGTDLLGIAGDGDGLEDTLTGYRDRVAVVAQYVTEDHILQRFLVILVSHIEGDIRLGA